MRTVLVLTGPNLNLLGEREPEIYGSDTLEDCIDEVRKVAAEHGWRVEALQSNHEGALIDAIHAARHRIEAIVINPGAFTHYSYAIADALALYTGYKVELHISNTGAREAWRRTSVIAPVVHGTIAGFGRTGYRLAAEAVVERA
ncbi:MAG: type II 3-dehydroquinate dehydratase [Acidimicrobiia bacterium]